MGNRTWGGSLLSAESDRGNGSEMRFLIRRAANGWTVLVGVILAYFTTAGVFYYSYGAFLPAMQEDLGWKSTAVGAGLSISLVAYGLPSTLIGKSIARFGPRANVIIGSLVAAAGLAAVAATTEPTHLYFFFGVLVGLGAGFGHYMACTTLVTNWFFQKRALALALVVASGGLAGLVFPPLVTWLIMATSWRMAWLSLAAIHLAVTAGIAGFLLIRNSSPATVESDDTSSNGRNEMYPKHSGASWEFYQTSIDFDIKQAMKDRAIWLLAVVMGISWLALGTITAHQVAFARELNLSPMAAAAALGVVPGASIVGRLMFGVIAHKIHVRTVGIICCLFQLIAFAIIVGTESLLYVYAALFGLSYGGLVVALPVFISAYYGRENYARVLGLVMPFALIACAAGPLLGGWINDVTGTYTPAFVMLAGLSILALLCAILLRPPQLREAG